ncbi:MAG: hypothetical protein ACJ76Y_26410 [Thermoanaerobaculia bacterium]
MRLRKILPVLALAVLWASCQKADPVVGKWVEAEGDGWAEYFADGDFILNDGAKSASGTWKRLDDGRIKVETLLKGNGTVEVYQVAIVDGAATFTSSAGRERKYQRSGGTATAGKDEWSEINPRLSRDREAQRKTVADVRSTGTAMFSWLTDQVGAAAAGQSERERNGRWTDLRSYAPISHAELEKILVPHYLQSLPEVDGWGYRYEYYLNVPHPLASRVMGIRSPGRDGVFSATEYSLEPFDPDDFYEDVVWSDGFFVRWPQKQAQNQEGEQGS